LSELIAKYHATNAYQIAEVYAFRNQSDEAFEWLDRAFAQRNSGLIVTKPPTEELAPRLAISRVLEETQSAELRLCFREAAFFHTVQEHSVVDYKTEHHKPLFSSRAHKYVKPH
jgi:hypothetical protein